MGNIETEKKRRGALWPRPRFWQKIYVASLLLFVACLCACLYGVLNAGRRQSFDARRDEFLSRQHRIAEALAQDIAAVQTTRPNALPALYEYYGERYAREGVLLTIWQNGEEAYNSQPKLVGRDELATLAPGQRVWQVRVLQNTHYFYAATMLQGEGGYTVSACMEMEDFYREWSRLQRSFALFTAAVTLLFAVGMWALLSRMNRPLRQLTDTAAALARGELAARANATRQDELGELAVAMNRMAEQVERQMEALREEAEAKGRLVDNLSHEMRTPLTAIGGYAEYLQRASLTPDELHEATDTIRFESGRLLKLSSQLVRLSVLAHEPPEAVPLDVTDAVERAVQAVRPKAAAGAVPVLAELPRTPVMVKGDAELLESLFLNLLDNGVKACREGGRVTVTVACGPDGGAQVTVRDTGCGMSGEALRSIGQPFYRADKARSRAEGGAGLGVALCRSIADAHDATLTYESEPGQGTQAILQFPPVLGKETTFTRPKQVDDAAATTEA